MLLSNNSMMTIDDYDDDDIDYHLRQQKQWLDTSMSNMLLQTYTYLRQPKILLDYKRNVQETITRCLAMIMEEKFKIFLIGSSLTSLGSNRSDIDLCMVIYDRYGQVDERYQNRLHAEYTLDRIRKILEHCGLAYDSKVIRANVPILKFYDHNHIEVNLNLNKLVTVQNTLLLMYCCSLDSRVAPFLFTIKLWAQKNGINCAYFKSLSSYALSLMSIFFLQNVCEPPILPSFDHILELIKQSTKIYSNFYSNSSNNKFNRNKQSSSTTWKNCQSQDPVLRQLNVTTSADYYYLQKRNNYHQQRQQQQQNLIILPPPPPPTMLPTTIIPSSSSSYHPLNIPHINNNNNNISRVSLVPDFNYHHQHQQQQQQNGQCCASPSSLSSNCSSPSSNESSSSLDSSGNETSTSTTTTSDNSISNNVLEQNLNDNNNGNKQQQPITKSNEICNLHFSHNVPAAIAMTLATQQQQQNCCLKQLQQQQQQQHQLTTANMMNVEQKSKKIAGFRKWKHQQPVGNQQPPIDNDGKTFTASAAVEADNNTIISSSSSSLHMNYFTFYYYYYFLQQQQFFPSCSTMLPPPPPFVDHHHQQQQIPDDDDDDKEEEEEEEVVNAEENDDNNHRISTEELISPTLDSSYRSSPTTTGVGTGLSSSSSSSTSSRSSSSSTSDSGFFHNNNNNYHNGTFDRTLYDRLSLLNLSPPSPLTPNDDYHHHCKCDFSLSNENLQQNCANIFGDELDLFNQTNHGFCIDPSLQSLSSSSSSSASTSSTSSSSPLMFKSPNTQSMGALFSKFIDYYSDPAIYNYVISVRTGSLMKRTDPIFARNSHTSMDTFICVEEPFNHTNTSHSVHNDFMFNFILKSFRWTKDLLQKMKMNSDDFV
uniref:Myb-like protein AA n=1 Tax=Dermatophagoides pteronyssinus TaxID=6956 RepID=A0A6P6XPH7_DERPT|nr:myb-like protein AA [Dermatophagoides pteronyssinus]